MMIFVVKNLENPNQSMDVSKEYLCLQSPLFPRPIRHRLMRLLTCTHIVGLAFSIKKLPWTHSPRFVNKTLSKMSISLDVLEIFFYKFQNEHSTKNSSKLQDSDLSKIKSHEQKDEVDKTFKIQKLFMRLRSYFLIYLNIFLKYILLLQEFLEKIGLYSILINLFYTQNLYLTSPKSHFFKKSA